MNDSTNGNPRGLFGSKQLPLESETCFFILVNALDVFMTFILLELGGFRESNELANQVLNKWGITGMVYFKFGIVAAVTVIAQFVARRNITAARYLLNFGSILVGCVVLYSLYLFVRYSDLF